MADKFKKDGQIVEGADFVIKYKKLPPTFFPIAC
jgi:hypothetical protein